MCICVCVCVLFTAMLKHHEQKQKRPGIWKRAKWYVGGVRERKKNVEMMQLYFNIKIKIV